MSLAGPRCVLSQDKQLLTKGEVFQDYILTRMEALTSHPSRCRSQTIMTRIIFELLPVARC